MGDSKSIGQLLKELDAMQKQFDNLNEELIVENRKKKRVKTELTSNEIDDDFFKTFSAPLIEKNIINEELEKISEEDLADDDLLFELEIQQKIEDSDSVIENKISKKEIIEEKNNIVSSENDEVKIDSNKKPLPIQTKDVESDNKKTQKLKGTIDEQKKELKDYSYLTIKERLERIQHEISLKEAALKEVKLKNTQQDKTKIVKLKQTELANKILVPKKDDKKNNYEKLEASSASVLKPTKPDTSTVKKSKTKVKSALTTTEKKVFSSKAEDKKVSPLNSTKIVSKEVKTKSNNTKNKEGSIINKGKVYKQKNKKQKKIDTLTVIILILLLVLLVTAWVLLF